MKSIVFSTALFTLASAVVKIPDPANPPHQVAASSGQIGYNDCQKFADSKTANCQTLQVIDANDFCLFGPPKPNSEVGDTEHEQVAWCTKAGHGARLIPKGTFKGIHFVTTTNYIQITGHGDFTKMNIKKGDAGGELDPHGATQLGNPVGGLVIGRKSGKPYQFQEWHQFIGADVFSLRACFNNGQERRYCPHIYDEMGAEFNDPGRYDNGVFEQCNAKSVPPVGEYKVVKNGVTTTTSFHQGDSFTPAPKKPASSSKCTTFTSIPGASYPKATTTKKVRRQEFSS